MRQVFLSYSVLFDHLPLLFGKVLHDTVVLGINLTLLDRAQQDLTNQAELLVLYCLYFENLNHFFFFNINQLYDNTLLSLADGLVQDCGGKLLKFVGKRSFF